MFKFKTLAATLALVAMAGMAQAAPMVYTFEVYASGQLNGQGFTNTAVTVTLTGESSVEYAPCWFCYMVLADTTLIEVAGLGSDSFLNRITGVSNFVDGYIGFGEPVSDYGIFFIEHPSVLTYYMQTPLGPVSGVADAGNPGVAFATLSGGSFTFDTVDSLGTFTAVAAQVPEPATWALLLVGLVPLLRRRRA